MQALDEVFVSTILQSVSEKLGVDLALMQLGKRALFLVLGEAEQLQKDAEQSGAIAVMRRCNVPLTLENYLAFNRLTECAGDQWEIIPKFLNPYTVESIANDIADCITDSHEEVMWKN